MVDGRWSMVDGRWSMVDGRWSMVDGRWSMVDGRWSMVDGRWLRMVDHHLAAGPRSGRPGRSAVIEPSATTRLPLTNT
jgi:hypothetical protein